MPTSDNNLLALMQACAAQAPKPLYPRQFAESQNADRGEVDAGLDELRRRGLVRLTEWARDLGQGVVLTELGLASLKEGRIPKGAAAPIAESLPDRDDDDVRLEALRQVFAGPRLAPGMLVFFGLTLVYFFAGAAYAMVRGFSVEDYLLSGGPDRTQVLIDLGALHPGFMMRDGGPARPQFERIILFNFLHIGLIHLAMNLYFLAALGPLIEALWGSWRFVVIYAISGIVSGCMVLLIAISQTADNAQIGLTAGASGCLFGIFTSMIVWYSMNYRYLPENVINAWSRSLRLNIFILIAINFLPGISWQGHFGGAVGGLLAALLLHVQRFHGVRWVRVLALCALPVVPLAFFVAVLSATGWL